jgi:hypothetical protein
LTIILTSHHVVKTNDISWTISTLIGYLRVKEVNDIIVTDINISVNKRDWIYEKD